jgi:hypothetical protein
MVSRSIAVPFRDPRHKKGMGWLAPRPGRFIPGNDPVPIVQEAGWAPGPVWTAGEISSLPGFDLRTAQLVASHYTD